jgi:hypothetical protein
MVTKKDNLQTRISERLQRLVVVFAIAMVGMASLILIKAASPSVSIEPEIGQVVGGASVISVTDGSASSNKYIRFKAAAITGGLWQPTTDVPLKLGWILEGAISVTNLQTKNLNGTTIPEADVYDIDGEYNTAATVQALHNKGKKVICYIDTGVYEDYRGDAAVFQAITPTIWGNKDNGWDGSFWLDIRRISELAPIMKARIQMCKDKGFDSIEPDEMVNYTNSPGFPLTYADQLAYNKAVASWAHAAGISIGLKDDHEQAHDLVNDFDWMLDEECWAYDECIQINDTGPGGPSGTFDSTTAFTKKNKAVWIAEYPDGDNGNGSDYPSNQIDKTQPSHLIVSRTNQICNDSIANRLNTAFYITGLPSNGGRTDCPQFIPR